MNSPLGDTISTKENTNWVAQRSSAITDMYDRAVRAGLTGHTITGRRGKTLTVDGKTYVEFTSCSYLGLEDHPRMIQAVHAAVDRYGMNLSSSRNSMEPIEAVELEDTLGKVYPGMHALVFNCVSSVHLGLLPLLGANTLPNYPISLAGPLFVIERTAHASIQVLKGIYKQLGPVTRFRIDDEDTLAEAMNEARRTGRTPIILVDGIGSMGGLIDVAHLQQVAENHSGYLYIDDAHGISIDGPSGAGYAYQALGSQVPANVLLAGSLSKAFGGSGGFILLHEEADRRVLRREGNTMVFGHANMITHMVANAESARMHFDGTVATLQEQLWANVAYFDEVVRSGDLINAGTRSPIRGLALDSEEAAFNAAVHLRDAGVVCFPVFYPLVAKGTGLLRFGISATHTRAQITNIGHLLASA
ncbi:aminotransferase class I/II-fold pyridoxal phosphate-dependent enzyme [Streptomyces sp. NPDC056656]|uniref:aminotransferase class I/II-fold pyridoxal phosphate-dependent enzyme n=1 Tax=Streptomyces sp. NPDC056656 TaxID=3345895 RepID=UPI00367D057C